jgi:octaprenyl-diphosphate synthase
MVEAGSLEVLGILSHAAAVIAEGEVQQLTTSNDTATTELAYLDVIRGKTAQLFAAAARVGAVIAGRPAAEADALEAYGLNIGIAFQLVDDVLDYSARQAELGKTVGDDFREGKLTLPVILAFERGDESERTFWRRTVEELEQREGDLAEAVTLMERHHALAESIDRARHYAEQARGALAIFPDQPIRRALLDAVDFTVERAY